MKAAVVISKCSKRKKTYGIRIEEVREKEWMATWAFPISENAANREGYGKKKIEGDFVFHARFPGCLYCENDGFVYCGNCEHLSCWDNETRKFVCSWCSIEGDITGTVDSLTAGTDI